MLYIGGHYNPNEYIHIMDILLKMKQEGGNCIQIFLGDKIHTTLKKKYVFDITEKKEIRSYLKENNMKLFIHSIYTINFCFDPFYKRFQWGLDNLIYDMNICHEMGGEGCVLHFGHYQTKKVKITKEECIQHYIDSIIYVLDHTSKTKLYLETSVGNKDSIGGIYEDILFICNQLPKMYHYRIRVCVDTAHIFVAGYNIRELKIWNEFINAFKKSKWIGLIHLNDTLKELDSRVNRHSPIGNGLLFSEEDNPLLREIVHFSNKENIPLLLETDSINYKSEIAKIKNIWMVNIDKLERQKNPSKPDNRTNLDKLDSKANPSKPERQKNPDKLDSKANPDIRLNILTIFKEICEYYEILSKEEREPSTIYKIASYKKAIHDIESRKEPVYSIQDLPEWSTKMKDKVIEIIDTGTLKLYQEIQGNKKYQSRKLFMKIWGVGTEKAKEWVNQDLHIIDDLIQKNIQLTEQQKIGIKYYHDLQQHIPYSTIELYKKYLKNKIKPFPNYQIHDAGSHSRGKNYSMDMDFILSYSSSDISLDTIYNTFKSIIYDSLLDGNKKKIWIVKLPKDKYYRQMDIAFVPDNELIWYKLYFCYGQEMSKKMRQAASKKGYLLNEKGLFDKKTKKKVNLIFKSHKEVFDFLEMTINL